MSGGRVRDTLDAVRQEPGWGLVRVDIGATVLFAVVQIVATVVASRPVLAVAVAVALALFFAGCVAYAWAYLVAIGRSRDEVIGLGGLFFLANSAPDEVRQTFTFILVAQILVALVTAGFRVFTPVAFGILAPMFGLGIMALWAARYGTFPRHDEQEARRPGTHEHDDDERDEEGGRAPESGGAATPRETRRRRWWEPVDLDEE